MFRMTTALLLLCFVTESRAQDKARMATGEHVTANLLLVDLAQVLACRLPFMR